MILREKNISAKKSNLDPTTNGTIERLKTRIKELTEQRDLYQNIKRIIRDKGTIEDIIALGVDPAAAKALMIPDSILLQTQSISISQSGISYLEKQLEREIAKQLRINDKYGRK